MLDYPQTSKNHTNNNDGLLNLEVDILRNVVKKSNILDFYDVDKTPLGRGKYATVCRAVNKQTGTEFAAKFVKKRRRNHCQMKEIVHEIAVLMQCAATSRVIRLHEVYESITEMVLVLELAAGGELQHILDGGQCLNEHEARKAMRQILEGVAYLHARNIAHLDLKPQNLLLSRADSCDDIKLCDFGISKVLRPGVIVREILGTVDYVAPEVLSYEPICLTTDIWSIGVLGYVLLSGFSPFGADDKQRTFLNIAQCALSFEAEHFDDVSSAAVDFIKSALVVDPRKRPSVHSLLDHPWISLKSSLLSQPPPKTSDVICQRKSLTGDGNVIKVKINDASVEDAQNSTITSSSSSKLINNNISNNNSNNTSSLALRHHSVIATCHEHLNHGGHAPTVVVVGTATNNKSTVNVIHLDRAGILC